MSRKIQLTKLNSGYCTDPEQDIIAAPVAAEVDLLTPTPVDVSQGALWRSPLAPTVTSVGSLVNCSAAVVPSSTNVSVTGSTTGAGSLEFTLDDGDSGTDSNTLTLNIVGSSGGSIAAYSGSDERGTQANPAVSPFGTMLLASVSGTPADELFSELYGANWDFGDANAGLVDYGPRVGQSANTVHSTLITNHTYTVPDGQGVTEFITTVTIKASTGEEYTATKSIWVVDQETHFGAANTVYVSNTLSPVDEATFTAAGALAGATYLSAPPAYNTYAGKRVQFYGGDVFAIEVLVGLGQHGTAISSWGTGNAEISQTLKVDAKSNGLQSAAGGAGFVKDADVIAAGGFTKNYSISNIRIGKISLGLAVEGCTIDRVDSDYSNITVPDINSGSITLLSSYGGMYTPANGLDPSNANYSAGLFISNSAFVGSSALSISTGSSSGNIFDFVGGTSVTSMDVDSTTYNPNDVVPLTSFGSMTIAANGDYNVTVTSYSHSTNIQIDVLTDDGVKTFYTGACRPTLNISGIYAQVQGIGLSNTLCKNSREHNERIASAGLFSALDTEDGAGFEQIQKHGRTMRNTDSSLNDSALGNVPLNTGAFGGDTIPFGNEGIPKWGGTARDADNFWFTDQSYFSQSHVKSVIQKSMTGGAAAASHYTSNSSTVSATDPAISGIKDAIWHDIEVVTDNAGSSSILLNAAVKNLYRFYLIKGSVSGAKTEFTPLNGSVWNRDGVHEPYYLEPDDDLPAPI